VIEIDVVAYAKVGEEGRVDELEPSEAGRPAVDESPDLCDAFREASGLLVRLLFDPYCVWHIENEEPVLRFLLVLCFIGRAYEACEVFLETGLLKLGTLPFATGLRHIWAFSCSWLLFSRRRENEDALLLLGVGQPPRRL
jgi:hypothetical protein